MTLWRGKASDAVDMLRERGIEVEHAGEVVIWATGQEAAPLPMRYVEATADEGARWVVEVDLP